MSESSQWILDRPAPVLREQDGFATSAQARLMNAPESKIDRLVTDGRLQRRRRSVCIANDHAPNPRVPERIHESWLAIDGRRLPWERTTPVVVVSHTTAATMLGLGTIPDDGRVHLTALSESGRSRQTDIALDRSTMLDIDDWRWERERRVAVTSPARTVVDLVVAEHEREYRH